jgi:transcriptional regulator with GAF, ATPase, and Fis domain
VSTTGESEHHSEGHLSEVFAEVARQLEAGKGPAEVLRRITTSAVAVVPGCDHAGVSIIEWEGRIETRAATDDVPRLVDTIQYKTGQGPCLETIGQHETSVIHELARECRWPEFSRRAAELTGVSSMLSFRLFIEQGTIGALNLYSRQSHAFDEHSRAIGAVLAAHAAVAIVGSQQRERADNLESALRSSREIGIAVGILMARGFTTREQAFDLLRAASQHLNIKLRDLASAIADTGEFPKVLDSGMSRKRFPTTGGSAKPVRRDR